MKKILSIGVIFSALSLTSVASQSFDRDKIGVGIGAGVQTKLFKKEKDSVALLPILDIRKDSFYIEGLKVGYDAYKNDILSLSVFLDPLAGFFVESEDMREEYKTIYDRDPQAMVGLKSNFRLFKADPDYSMNGSALVQVGEHGVQGKLSLSKVYSLDKFRIIPSVSIAYFNSDFSDYYFGVTQNELSYIGDFNRTYDADNSFSMGVKLTGGYQLNDKLSLMIFMGVDRMSDEIKNSPLIDNQTIFSVGVGAKYFF